MKRSGAIILSVKRVKIEGIDVAGSCLAQKPPKDTRPALRYDPCGCRTDL